MVSLFALSCVVVDEMTGGELPDDGENVDIVLRLKTPGAYPAARTRALTEVQEFTVSSVNVLAFRSAGGAGVADDVLVAIEEGAMEGAITTSGTFTVELHHSHLDKSRKLVVLANMADVEGIGGADGALEQLTEGMTYAAVVETLQAAISGKMFTGTYDPGVGMMPMYGETEYKTISQSTSFNVDLARSIARIDVGVGAAVTNPTTDEVTWPNADNIPFRITDVYVMRPGRGYSVMPTPGVAAGEPSVPATGDAAGMFTAAESVASFGYGAEAIDASGLFTMRSIYVPEASVLDGEFTERMALVVGGKYDDEGNGFADDATTYHRVDFYDGANLLDVVRNHLYRFEIAGVVGEGFANAELAYSTVSANIKANVLVWSDAPLEQVYFKGDYYVSASPKTPATLGSVAAVEGEANEMTVVFETNINSGELAMFRTTVGTTPDLTTATPYENGDFTYTLARAGQTYSLTITAKNPNFGATAEDIINDWTVDVGGVINFPYRVIQTASETDPTMRAVNVTAQYDAAPGDMGSAMANVASAAVGKSVTVSATPKAGYEFTAWTASGEAIVPAPDLSANPLTFEMPAGAVTLTAGFVRQAAVYTIEVTPDNAANGEAQANYTAATQGTVVSVLASPKTGYKFNGWSVAGGGVSLSNAMDNPATFTVLEADVQIAAAFLYDPGSLTGGDYSITITSANGSAIASPANADENTQVTLMATPADGYKFLSWSTPVNATWSGDSSTATNPAKIIVGAGDVTVTANYVALNNITMARNDDAWGTASSSVARAAAGDKVSVTAVAAPGYIFKSWSATGGAGGGFDNASANPALYTMGDGAATITATFVRQEQLLSVVPNNRDWGSVTASPSSPVAGETVTLTTNASANYTFPSDNYVVITGDVTVEGDTFTMPSDGSAVSIRANFVPVARTLTLTSAAGGTVSASNGLANEASEAAPGRAMSLAGGDRVTITAVASNATYVFSGWDISPAQTLTPSAASYTATFTMPQGNVSVAPLFDRVFTPQITAENGSFTMSAPNAKAGASIKLTAAPDTGYRFVSWALTDDGGGAGLSATNTPTTTLTLGASQSADPVLVATFEAVPERYAITITPASGGKAQASYTTAKSGDEVKILASPNPGQKFKQWIVTAGGTGSPTPTLTGLVATDNPATFTMPENPVTLQAEFEMDDTAQGIYTVKASATAGEGSVVASTAYADTGDEVSLMATPAATWRFHNWSWVTAQGTAALTSTETNPTTLTVGTANVEVKANFVKMRAVDFGAMTNGTASATATEAASGDPVTATATADPGYVFTHWSGAPIDGSTTNPAPFTMPATAVTLTANFERQTEPLSVVSNNDAWGSVTADPATPKQGQTVTLTTLAESGYQFSGFTVINGGVTPDADKQFTMPSGQVSIRANFAPVDRTITVAAATAQGSATVTSNAGTAASGATTTAKAGERVTIEATAATGYVFDGWNVTGTTGDDPAPATSPAATNPSSFIVPTGNVTLTPLFAQVFTPQITPPANGTVVLSPPYARANETITLTASPANGFRFVEWTLTDSGGGAHLSATDTPTATLTMATTQSSNPVITATFLSGAVEPTEITITAAPGTPATSGTVSIVTSQGTAASTLSASGTASAHAGEYVTLTATATAGWDFDGWETSGTGTISPPPANSNPSGFVAPAGDVTIAPRFAKLFSPVITASGGSVTRSTTAGIRAGQTMTLSASPATGNRFTGWSMTNSGGGAYLSSQIDASVTLTMSTLQTANPEITANFEAELEGFVFPVEADVVSVDMDGNDAGAEGGTAYVTIQGETDPITSAEPTDWLTFTATPSPMADDEHNGGWWWRGWTLPEGTPKPYGFGDDDVNMSNPLTNILMPNGPLNLQANFEEKAKNAVNAVVVSVNSDGSDGGTAGGSAYVTIQGDTDPISLAEPTDYLTFTAIAPPTNGTNIYWIWMGWTVQEGSPKPAGFGNADVNMSNPLTGIQMTNLPLTLVANFKVPPWGLLYFDLADNNRLKIGTWGEEVNASNLAYFRFGGTVGFTMTDASDQWGTGDIKFNPTTTPNSTWESNGVTSIPEWGGYTGTKPVSYDLSNNQNYFSTSNYHNISNVKRGFGDPCQLVGYTAGEIKQLTALPIANFRLPTTNENLRLVGYTGSPTTSNVYSSVPFTISGSNPQIVTFASGNSLPLTGFRNATPAFWNIWGAFSSASPSSSTHIYYLTFHTDNNVTPAATHSTDRVPAVRCVLIE